MAFCKEVDMKAPQIIMITVLAMGLGITLVKNGEPKDGEYSFLTTIISTVIEVAILWWGGFFG